jgi:hypothetical protein
MLPPEGAIFVRKPSNLPPPGAGWNALLVGKSVEYVVPATNTSPAASRAMAEAESMFEPPRYDDHRMPDPAPLIFVTNASCAPA